MTTPAEFLDALTKPGGARPDPAADSAADNEPVANESVADLLNSGSPRRAASLDVYLERLGIAKSARERFARKDDTTIIIDPDGDDEMDDGDKDKSKDNVIEIRGVIEEEGERTFLSWIGIEMTSSKQVIDRLAEIEGDVQLRINSPGGLVSEMSVIIAALADRQEKGDTISAFVDGMAASAAATIFLAADSRAVAEYAEVMFHRAMLTVFGAFNQDDLKELVPGMVERLDGFDRALLRNLVARTELTEAEATEALERERWFDAETARDVGLANAADSAGEAESGGEDKPEMRRGARNHLDGGILKGTETLERLARLAALNN